MKTFDFDEDKSFEENLDQFLHFLTDEDAEMANVLRSSLEYLTGVTSESDRSSARTKFNESVLQNLKRIVADEEKLET